MTAYNRTTLAPKPRRLSVHEMEDLVAGCGPSLTPGQITLLRTALLKDRWLTTEDLGHLDFIPTRSA